jgi:hypothetical protein
VISTQFRTNRAAIPWSELEQYRGQWVAFSPDGTKIVANGTDLDDLESKIKAAGHDPNEVVLENVPGEEFDTYLGSGELA